MDTRPCRCRKQHPNPAARTRAGDRYGNGNYRSVGADRDFEACGTQTGRRGAAIRHTRGRAANRFLLKYWLQLPSAQPTLMREAASGTSRRSWLKSDFAPGANVRTGAFIVQL